MMFEPEINKDFSSLKIASFIIQNDTEGIFLSAKQNFREFVKALERLNEIKHIIVFRDGERLVGVFGWFFIKEENKHEVGKQIWRLPDNLLDGDILYLAFILTIEKCDVIATKRIFEDYGYRKRIKKIRGFSKDRWFEHNVHDY